MKDPIEAIEEFYLKEAKEALNNPYQFKKSIKNVAVIGAGVSGLTSARHLVEAGFNVRVFDRNSAVGGVWLYSDQPPVKPQVPTPLVKSANDVTLTMLKDCAHKEIVSATPEVQLQLEEKYPTSACYRDMHTNIPTKYLALSDFPFPADVVPFCPHSDMLSYLTKYALHFELRPLITFNTSVESVCKNAATDKWDLILRQHIICNDKSVEVRTWKESFDSVVIASGAYQVPYIPDYKDLRSWNDRNSEALTHSKQFRAPEIYSNKNVLVIGGSISGIDIVRSLEGFAKNIYFSIRGPFKHPLKLVNLLRETIPSTVIIKPKIEAFSALDGTVNGSISFTDGSVIDDIDHVIFCTGYSASFGFLNDLKVDAEKTNNGKQIESAMYTGQVYTNGNYPLNVYKEIFVISDPTLAFIGIQQAFATPFYMDGQSHAVARVWSNHAFIPNQELMIKSIDNQPSILSYEPWVMDRLRRDQITTWINYHARHCAKKDTSLVDIRGYHSDYDKDMEGMYKLWQETSTENFKKTRDAYSQYIIS